MRLVEVFVVIGLAQSCAFGAAPFRQMFVFGDSYSDTGAGYLDGNGPTAVAYLARAWKLDLAPFPQVTSPHASLNFAVSGAQTGAGEGKHIGTALLGLGMQNQVAQFTQLVKQGKIEFDAADTLFLLAGGLNDRDLPTATTIANLKDEVRKIYELGGRRFAIALLPEAIPSFGEMGRRLNPALSLIPAQMKASLPQARISLSRWGLFFDEVLRNPERYGIEDTAHACAGREIFHEDAKPCAKPETYFYYHAEHPSTAAHKAVGAKMAAEKYQP